MSQDKFTHQQAVRLQKQIQHDQAQPVKPAEKRYKIENPQGFDNTIKVLSQPKKV